MELTLAGGASAAFLSHPVGATGTGIMNAAEETDASAAGGGAFSGGAPNITLLGSMATAAVASGGGPIGLGTLLDTESLLQATSNVTSMLLDEAPWYNTTLNATQWPPGGPPRLNGQRPVTSILLRGEVRIPLYSLIFLLSVVGNTLVIVTLAQNKRMRTVTNVFLLNLSISDMLLAVFCMPFTLIPTLLRDFIFGKTMCIMIRYLQAVSVGVSVFTLVSISLERYFAICHPLRSRSWQTLSHSYKMIVGVWMAAFIVAIPIGVCQRLMRVRDGRHKCMEIWTNPTLEKTYTIFLDLVLLLLPLVLMLVAYGLISRTLWKGMQLEMRSTQSEMKELRNPSGNRDDEEGDTDEEGGGRYGNGVVTNGQNNRGKAGVSIDKRQGTTMRRKFDTNRYQNIRHSNTEKSLAAKKRVIRMLFVVVVEFFICWTPLWIMNTWYTLEPRSAYTLVSPVCMNFIHLLSYVSSCCNPITYCFMNKKFRHAFLAAFHRCGSRKKGSAAWREASTFGQSQRTVFSSVRSHDVLGDGGGAYAKNVLMESEDANK